MLRRLALCLGLCLTAAAAHADYIDLYANPLDMPQNKGPRVGHSKVVLIPVQIDFAGYKPVDLGKLRTFFTEPAAHDRLNFNGYFETASGGRWQGDVTVAPLVEYKGCPSMLDQASCTIERGDVAALSKGMDFVRDVFRRSHDENKVDFSAFDANGLGGDPDGVIDGAMIVVNVPSVGIAFPIQYVNGGSNLSGGNGGPLVLDGIKIPYCAIGGARFAGGEQHLEYVILHEFGHTLGLADLYYEHPAAGDKYPSWGGLHFSLMGDYDYSDKAILPDAESRRALGWQQHVVVSGTRTLTLQPAAAGGFAVKLGIMSKERKEYFLVEARGPDGAIDKGVVDAAGKPTYGLAVYHVDWSRGPKPNLGEWTARMVYCLDCDPFHPFIRNLESSGTFGLLSGSRGSARSAFGGGASDDQVLFAPGQTLSSIPNAPPLSPTYRYVATNYYDGTESGISIKDILVNADHTVTATFTAPPVADPCSDVVCPPLEQCIPRGAFAGSCEAIPAPQPGTGVGGHSVLPAQQTSGCSSGGTPGALCLLLLGALALRRKQATRAAIGS